MTKIKYNKTECEVVKDQESKILSIVNIDMNNVDDLPGCLLRTELLAKRLGLKEVWIPIDFPEAIEMILETKGYLKGELYKDPETNIELKGFRKLL